MVRGRSSSQNRLERVTLERLHGNEATDLLTAVIRNTWSFQGEFVCRIKGLRNGLQSENELNKNLFN